MSSKKSILVVALIVFFHTIGLAQTSKDWGWDWKDSSKVPAKRIPQYKDFMSNKYPFPAKPRDQFEVGIDAGYAYMFSDLDSRFGDFGGASSSGGLSGISAGGSIHVRKALTPSWSVRLAYTGAITYGLDYRPRTTILNRPLTGPSNNPWQKYYEQNGLVYFANFRNKLHSLSFDFIYTLNNISYFNGNPKWNIYVFAGYSPSIADVDVNALDSKGHPYYFSTVAADSQRVDPYGNRFHYINLGRSRGAIRKEVGKILDGTYESNAATDYDNRANIQRIKKNWLLRHGIDFGAGFSYKINDKWNVGMEQKFIHAWEDQWDGVREGNGNDILGLTTVHINRNFGNTSKRVQPLWWINPMNFIFNELNEPKHMKIPTQKLPDADGDGVTDQFDLEKNTPKGASVDSHGRTLDSDGDGIPDYKDKEPFTQNKCLPVNSDGVGVCPEPACCSKISELQSEIDSLKNGMGGNGSKGSCKVDNLPSIEFKKGVKLSKEAEKLLEAVSVKMKSSPSCKLKVIGHPQADKISQQRIWERVQAVIKYLVEKQGISETRFIFNNEGGSGDANTIDLEGTTEDGPNTVPAPHPNLRNRVN